MGTLMTEIQPVNFSTAQTKLPILLESIEVYYNVFQMFCLPLSVDVKSIELNKNYDLEHKGFYSLN